MQAGGVGHLAGHGGGEEADGLEETGHVGHIARHHDDRHGFADGPADAQHDRGGDATGGGRDAHPEHGLDMGGAQGQRGLLVLLGHRLEGSLGYGDDGGQNHDGQHQNGAEQAGAVGQVEGHPHRRHQNHHADETVHHGRDARQQIHCRAHQAGQTGRRYLGQEHCGHEAHRYAQDNGPGGAVDGGKDEGQYAELGLGGGGGPLGAEEEVHQPDLADGGQAGHDQVDTDEEDKDDRDQTADKKQEVHKDFQRSELLFHGK